MSVEVSEENLLSSRMVDILSSEDLPDVIEPTDEATYPSCGHSAHELIADRGVEDRYWRRCRSCRKMASEPFFPRTFRRR